MSKPLPNLTDLPPDVQVYIAAQASEVMGLKADLLGLNLTHAAGHKRLKNEMEAERATFSNAIQNRDTIIADLRMQLDGHNKHRFGSRSESLDQLALELVLEEHEIAQAAEISDEDAPSDKQEGKPGGAPRANVSRSPKTSSAWRHRSRK